MPKKKESALRNRVIQYIKQKGMSVLAFERSLNLPNGTISQFSDNTNRSTLNKIKEYYEDFDVDYILTGKDNLDTNIYTEGMNIPYEFIKKLFAERELHDKHITDLIEENKKSGERLDMLISLIKEQMNIIKKMPVLSDAPAACADAEG